MTYPGDPSLSKDAQQRILGTFEQTLDLAEQGSRQEALLGCDFVLRLDPRFEPARRLQQRLKSSTGAVQVADLKAPAAGATAFDTLAGNELFELGDLEGELPELPLEDLPAAGGGESSPDPLSGSGLRAELQALFEQRRFQELVARAQAAGAALAAQPELAALAQEAQERMEAEPYVLKFLTKAREALRAGDPAEAQRLLAKGRSLDPTHPDFLDLERRIAQEKGAGDLPSALRPTPAAPALGFLDEGGGDSESERRIAQLLREGQAAFDGGDLQSAIDAWSRIFLIDIDHQEAARRIEQARRVKAERERQVEEIYYEGLARLEAGDVAAARGSFERVLEMQPGYLAAREALDQIEAGQVPHARSAPAGRESAASPAAEAGALALPSFDEQPGELKEEILVPPEPGEMPARSSERPRKTTAASREGSPRRTFLLVGSAVLVVVLVAAWFLYRNKDRFFPNSAADEATAAPVPREDPIARATALHQSGKTPIALAQLRRLPPGDPDYQRAQDLIARWEAAQAPAAPVATEPQLAPEVVARRQELLAAAELALGEGRNLLAVERFRQAGSLAELTAGEAAQLAGARHALAPLASQIDLFEQREWELALPALWRMREADPGNRDVTQLIVDSYYNLGVRDLQRSDAAKAVENFEEALSLDPDDADLRRHYLFAQTYQERSKDLLYRIYVKYLPFR